MNPRYETWEERDGATMRQRVGTDAPAGVRLVDADDYEALEAKNKELKRLLKRSHANEINRWTVGHTHVNDEYDPGCEVCRALTEGGENE